MKSASGGINFQQRVINQIPGAKMGIKMGLNKISKYNNTYRSVVCLLIVLFTSNALSAEDKSIGNAPMWSKAGWSVFTRGGYVHQLDADIDDGGSFSVNRFFIQAGPTYTTDNATSISLAAGYGFDGYSFSGESGFGGRKPWDDIYTLRLSIPVRWKMSQKWTGFVSPTVRSTGEKGADFNEAITGGGFAGFSYEFSDRLSIGPGIGVLTQLEDSTQVIPILVINWKINDTLSLNTGRGIGATLGPGLTLDWRPSRSWSFSLGGRYESLRFRLDENGDVPNGVGDDRAFPIFAGVGYSLTPMIRVSFIGGVEVGGKLRLENKTGRLITEEAHDPAGFVGFAFNARF